MYNILKEAKNKGPVAIFNNPQDKGESYVGFVKAVNEEEVLLYLVHFTGFSDGYLIMKLKDIFLVEEESLYTEKLRTLYRLQGQTHEEIPIDEKEITKSLLQYAKAQSHVVRVDLFEETDSYDTVGFVQSYGEGIAIAQYDSYGNPDGKHYAKMEDVCLLRCCGCQDVGFELLIKSKCWRKRASLLQVG